jgi:hypothetical protein
MSFVRYFMDPVVTEEPTSAENGFFTHSDSIPVQPTESRRQETYLLGQFDCVAVIARAEYDSSFSPLPHKRISIKKGQVQASGPVVTAVPIAGSAHHEESHGTDSNDLTAVEPTLLPHTATEEDPTTSKVSTIMLSDNHDCDGQDGLASWIWVVHAAAPNIGENANADDFYAYSKEEAPPTVQSTVGGSHGGHNPHQPCWKPGRSHRRLDEELYLSHVSRLWKNALMAMGRLGVDDGIMFPFGMGAFLRHLGLNDDRYNDAHTMRSLRRKVADKFVEAVVEVCLGVSTPAADSMEVDKGGKKTKPPPKKQSSKSNVKGPARVHLCLVVSNPESVDNHNSFVEAAADIAVARGVTKLKDVLLIRRNVDSLQLAHQISASQWQKTGTPKVAILNGACRKLVGNHWFQHGARFAIDENLHRRSASLARAALLLNLNTEPVARKPLHLASTVIRWGGQVFRASDGMPLFNDDPKASAKPATVKPPARPQNTGGSCFCCSRRKEQVKLTPQPQKPVQAVA